MKLRFRFCLMLLLSTFAGQAAERFELYNRPLRIPELGEVPGLVLLTEQNLFTFLPPPDWRASSDTSEKKVTLLAPDKCASMIVQLVKGNPALVPQIQVDRVRQQVRERFPLARLVEEFECNAGDIKGRAFDLQEEVNGRRICTRICFVALAEGSAEFTLTADPERFSRQHVAFASLLGSFRADPVRP